jgi:alpha-N-arabinofuranosidase
VAPPILEEIYTMQDALAFGGACISLLNHADRVKCACLAQLVNVIAPIMTETGGGAWRQTIFYPFQHMSRYGRGRVLRAQVACETYATSYYDPRGSLDQVFPIPAAPFLKAAAVATAQGGLSLFALNRDLARPMTVEVEARGFEDLAVAEALQLSDEDLGAVNSTAAPERVKPAPLDGVVSEGGKISLKLAPASWNLIALAPALRGGAKTW